MYITYDFWWLISPVVSLLLIVFFYKIKPWWRKRQLDPDRMLRLAEKELAANPELDEEIEKMTGNGMEDLMEEIVKNKNNNTHIL